MRPRAAAAVAACWLVGACGAGAPPSPRLVAPRPLVATTAPATSSPGPPPPALAPSATPNLPLVVEHGRRDRPEVALTFDTNLTAFMSRELDTGRVASFDNRAAIDELIALRVPATLFLSGLWMLRYPAETRRLAAVPWFELASHSYAHVGFAPHCYGLGLLPRAAMAPDVERSESVLHSFAPGASRLFRFPGGCYDGAALAAVAPAGVQVVQYDVASGDAFATSASAVVRHTLEAAGPGSIVVMHLTGGNTAPVTAAALPPVVRGLRARGYRLVTVGDLLRP